MFAGFALGWYRLADLLLLAETAMLAAMAAYAFQVLGPYEGLRLGATPQHLAVGAMACAAVAGAAVAGYILGRWQGGAQRD